MNGHEMTDGESGEGAMLAKEMHRAYMALMDQSMRRAGHTPDEAVAVVDRVVAMEAKRVARLPAIEMTWLAFNHLAKHDPESAVTTWAEIREAAKMELMSGDR